MDPRSLRRTLRVALARKPWRWRSAGLRARADRLRRAGEAAAAAALYRQYLVLRPDHGMAWCMLGHCLAAAGDRPGADAAYAQAAARDPQEPYIQTSRAVFLRQTGRLREARVVLRGVLAAGPWPEALRELDAIAEPPATPAADAAPAGARLFLDVSDLLAFAGGNRNLSGIQRVQAALMAEALREPARAQAVMTRRWDPTILSLSRDGQARLLALLAEGRGGTEEARALLGELERGAVPVPPAPGLRLMVAGAFWLHGGNPALQHALREAGMGWHALVYDLIPLTMPDVCVPGLVEEYRLALGELLNTADGLLAISEHTAAELRDCLAAHGLPPLPVTAVPLAHALRPPAGALPDLAAARRLVGPGHFVLSVGTIEARKNHAFLVRVWQAMVAEGCDPPPLVIVGKRGWRTDAFDAAMAETRAAGGRVRVLTEVSDAELESLYTACEFTAFPSLGEGWGLPVGESLARGRVCVTSHRGSLPEVGGRFALYVDPEDVPAAVPVFRRLLQEPGALEAAEAALDAFRPRQWPEVAREMLDALEAQPVRDALEAQPMRDALETQPAPPAPGRPVHPMLPPGRSVPPAAGVPPADPFGHPLRLAFADGWQVPEASGAAMAEPFATLRLALPAAGTLRLEFTAAGGVRLAAGGQSVVLPQDSAGTLEIPLAAGPVAIDLAATPADGLPPPDGPPGVTLTAMEFRADAP